MTYIKRFDWFVVFVLVSTAIFTSACVSNNAKEAESEEVARLKKDNKLLKQRLQQFVNPRVSLVRFGANPSLGNSEATVAIIEFSDYFCPFCGRFHKNTFDQIRKNYIDKGKLLYVYRDYPRGMEKQAVDAAIAANCAGEQGAYWKMQKTLYRHSPRINRAFYKLTAKEMGLNAQKYEACLSGDQQRNEVGRDFAYGRTLGIRGTPTFYIGRLQGKKITEVTRIVGAQPYAIFARTIERHLRSGKRP